MTPDGRRVVSASEDQTLKVWDLESGRAVRTLEGHTDSGDGVRGDAGRAARGLGVGGQDAEGVGPGERARAAHPGRPHRLGDGVAVTPDGRRVVSASEDRRSRCGTWRAGARCARSKATPTG